MTEIGGHPILWHIMSIYASHGFREFVVACGYKGGIIREYFHRFFGYIRVSQLTNCANKAVS